MTERELCEICCDYDVNNKCVIKNSCKLMNIVRENKKLKAELKSVKKELAELKSIRSWELYPDRMGK